MRATDAKLIDCFYLYGFLALVLQVFHLAESAEVWWTRRTRKTSREEDCIVLGPPRVGD